MLNMYMDLWKLNPKSLETDARMTGEKLELSIHFKLQLQRSTPVRMCLQFIHET